MNNTKDSENIRYGMETIGNAIVTSSVAISLSAILCCLIIKCM